MLLDLFVNKCLLPPMEVSTLMKSMFSIAYKVVSVSLLLKNAQSYTGNALIGI